MPIIHRFKLNQSGAVAQVALFVVLALGALGVYYLVNHSSTQLFSQASNEPVVFKSATGGSLPKNAAGSYVSTSPNIEILLTSPIDPSQGNIVYRIAEDPLTLDQMEKHNQQTTYTTTNPIPYTLTADTKVIWVEFENTTTHQRVRKTGSIMLSASSTPVNSVVVPLQSVGGSTGFTPNGTGSVTVNLIANDLTKELFTVSLSGSLNKLIPNRIYQVELCTKYILGCSTNVNPIIKTDSNGSAIFSGLTISTLNKQSNPIDTIRVIEYTSGVVPSNSCFLMTSPCIQGYYTVPNIAVSPNPTTSPTPIPTSSPQADVLSSTTINLTRTSLNSNAQSIGTLTVDLTEQTERFNDPGVNSMSVRISGTATGLEPNKKYQVWLCMQSLYDCSGNGSSGVATADSNGNVTFNNATISFRNKSNIPVTYINISEVASGEILPGSCTSAYPGCLTGRYSGLPEFTSNTTTTNGFKAVALCEAGFWIPTRHLDMVIMSNPNLQVDSNGATTFVVNPDNGQKYRVISQGQGSYSGMAMHGIVRDYFTTDNVYFRILPNKNYTVQLIQGSWYSAKPNGTVLQEYKFTTPACS